MNSDAKIALFLMLGQSAERLIHNTDEIAPPESLPISPEFELALLMPDKVKQALRSAFPYKLFFVFENYLREFVVDVLSKDQSATWWDKVPKDVQEEVTKLEENEETKSWMALGSRDKSALLTYPQLLRIIEHSWKEGFNDIVRDRTLVHEARMVGHLRNTICHMTEVPEEEIDRIKQVMKDWFRVVAP